MQPLALATGLGLGHVPTSGAADDGIPEGFEAVTQDGLTVTQDGEPVYVAE